MQYVRRNRSGPGLGTFAVVATSAFVVFFALGLVGSSGSVTAYDRLQKLSWYFQHLRSQGTGLLALGPWALPIPDSAGSQSETRRAETLYTVERGDTLSRIAARFGAEADALAAHNRLADPDLLEVGQTLRIPGSDPPPGLPKQSEMAASASPELPAVSSGPQAAASAPPAASSLSDSVDSLLSMAEEELSAARFDRALHTTLAVERLLATASDVPDEDTARYRARMELVRATAYAAVGHHEQVQNALSRALDANPDLELDPARTSPKLLQALEVARRTRESGGTAAAGDAPPGDEGLAAN